MNPQLHSVFLQLQDLALNPVVYNALILIALGMIPSKTLDKLPIVGAAVSLLKAYLSAQAAKQEARKVSAASVLADAAVGGFEQLKLLQKVDSGAAAAEATELIRRKTGLDASTSRLLVERAVKQQSDSDRLGAERL